MRGIGGFRKKRHICVQIQAVGLEIGVDRDGDKLILRLAEDAALGFSDADDFVLHAIH